jgi:hypothetical protein
MRTISALRPLACILGLAWSLQARADVYVIAHPGLPELNRQQVADLYLGRLRTLPSGEFATVLDQPNERPVREQFFRLLLNMPLSQVNAYWARLTFTGRQSAPEISSDDVAVTRIVGNNPRAIGYVASPPPAGAARVILHLHDHE